MVQCFFFIFINNLPDLIRSTVKLFSDDTKVLKALHDPEDYSYLQDGLDQLVKWSPLWQLHFNDGKCKVLHMRNSNPSHRYTMTNVPPTTTADEKDLCVIMDNYLKFHKHTVYTAKQPTRLLDYLEPHSHVWI